MSTFQNIAETTVASFLNSVVVIDDRAFSGKKEGNQKEEVETLKVPKLGGGKAKKEKESPADKDSFQGIDTESIIKAFSVKGLVCSVVSGKDFNVLPVAKSADVVVVDWQMDGDDGDRAISLIEKVIADDDGARSRFICIYSGVAGLDAIVTKLKSKKAFSRFEIRDDFFIFRGNVSITVLSKNGGISSKKWPERAVDNDGLPGRIIKEYASVNSGLLQHVAMRALAAVRGGTHSLLDKFSKKLDAPFVSHRVYSDPIEDVKSHVAPFVASELQSIIEQSGLSDALCRDVICKWVDGDVKSRLKCEVVGDGFTKDDAALIAKYYIENGAGQKEPTGVEGKIKTAYGKLHSKSAKKKSCFTQLLGSDESDLDEKRFAALTCLVASYGKTPPSLGPGTVVHDGNNYFLCVMPACDSARIPEEGRFFPFLLLRPSEEQCALIVPDEDGYIGLDVELKTFYGMNPLFKPAIAERDIVAYRCPTSGRWCFESDNGVKKIYHWVAALKPAHAQNIINAWAAHSSRVGLTESAWLQARKSKVFGGNR